MKFFASKVKLACVVLLSATLLSCSSKKANELDGKVLKDADGNYYLVRANVGDTVFLNKLDLSKYEKF